MADHRLIDEALEQNEKIANKNCRDCAFFSSSDDVFLLDFCEYHCISFYFFYNACPDFIDKSVKKP